MSEPRPNVDPVAIRSYKARKKALEWIGDATLGLIGREWVSKHFPDGSPHMDVIFEIVTCNNTLRVIGDEVIPRYQYNAPSHMGMEMEIGRIYLDDGLEAARKFVHDNILVYFNPLEMAESMSLVNRARMSKGDVGRAWVRFGLYAKVKAHRAGLPIPPSPAMATDFVIPNWAH